MSIVKMTMINGAVNMDTKEKENGGEDGVMFAVVNGRAETRTDADADDFSF